MTKNTDAIVSSDQEFLDYVVKALVDNPGAVKTTRKVDEMGVLLSVQTDKDDVGKLIGRQGNTAKALRTLLRVVGMKNHARVNLKIEEPEGSTHVPRERTSAPVDDMDDLKL
ncbi:MAG: KH domain-containing protein [bacterium]|nr:KH domain-containing protein [bacterium]